MPARPFAGCLAGGRLAKGASRRDALLLRVLSGLYIGSAGPLGHIGSSWEINRAKTGNVSGHRGLRGPDGTGCDSLAGDKIACPTRQGKSHRSDFRWAFRPVPGLGVSHMQFPLANAMGYFLSPFGLDVSEACHFFLARTPHRGPWYNLFLPWNGGFAGWVFVASCGGVPLFITLQELELTPSRSTC